MKSPALVSVAGPPEDFAGLFAAARAMGARLGWLDLGASEIVPVPADLARASELGALRAVAATTGRSVTVKATNGPPVLRDLLREHFLGVTLVLVRGGDGWPRLEASGSGFALLASDGRRRLLDAESLVREVARPRHRADGAR